MLSTISMSTLAFSFVLVGAALGAASIPFASQTPPSPATPTRPAATDLYGVKMKTLENKGYDFAEQRGKVLLIVNVASKCGYTPQYAQLEMLHQKYRDQGLVVIGVPSNDFGGQEPGSSEEIRDFCTKTYSVTFPMLEKVQTKKGDDQSELYRILGEQTKQLPSWNFCKYLVTRDGTVVTFFPSKVKPDSAELTTAIEAALAQAAPGQG